MCILDVDYFNAESIKLFWQKVLDSQCKKEIDIYLNYESARLLAVYRPPQILLVDMRPFKDFDRWYDIKNNEQEISDEEYERIMNTEIEEIFRLLKFYQPSQLTKVNYLSSWDGDGTYNGAFLWSSNNLLKF